MPPSRSNAARETEYLLGLGSNVGDKRAHLAAGLKRLAEHGRIVAVSALYRTSPVGFQDQDWFFNAAARLRTQLPPAEMLTLAKRIERDQGRVAVVRDGPRTLDIDLLGAEDDSGAVVSREKAPLLPHPRMHERRFVLEPLAEIAPDWEHPELERTISELLEALESDETVERLDAPAWGQSLRGLSP